MFVTFEGIEGAGKSTAMAGVARVLTEEGHAVVCTREPGGSDLGRKLRAMLLDCESRIVSRAELYLFLGDRAQHVEEVIRPALAAGKIVLCDRYTDSTLAYQGFARGLDPERLKLLDGEASGGLAPDLTLLFDLSVEEGLSRALQRNGEQGTSSSAGRFDQESIAFHTKVRNGFLSIAALEPERVRIIDAARSAEMVSAESLAVLKSMLKG